MCLTNSGFWEQAFKWYQWFPKSVYVAFFNKRQFDKYICKMQIILIDNRKELEEEIENILRNKPDYQLIDVLDFKTATKVRDFYNSYRARGRNGKRGRLTYKEILEKYRKGEITFD